VVRNSNGSHPLPGSNSDTQAQFLKCARIGISNGRMKVSAVMLHNPGCSRWSCPRCKSPFFRAFSSFYPRTNGTQIRTAISAQFPLRDILWNPSSRPAVRTIAELDVEARRHGRHPRGAHVAGPANPPRKAVFAPLHRRLRGVQSRTAAVTPAHTCTLDQDKRYVQEHRPQADQGLAPLPSPSARKTRNGSSSWSSGPTPVPLREAFFAMKSSVLDRIRADFNSDRKGQVRPAPLVPLFLTSTTPLDVCSSSGHRVVISPPGLARISSPR